MLLIVALFVMMQGLSSSDYRLLCSNSCQPATSGNAATDECNLGSVQGVAIVMNRNLLDVDTEDADGNDQDSLGERVASALVSAGSSLLQTGATSLVAGVPASTLLELHSRSNVVPQHGAESCPLVGCRNCGQPVPPGC